MIHQFKLDLEPAPASRPRVPRFGKPYYEGPYETFREEVPELVRKAWPQVPLMGPLTVEILIVKRRPKTTKLPFPKPDWDNYGKAVCDAMNGVVYVDDWQIYRGGVEKRWSEPGEDGYILVKITEEA